MRWLDGITDSMDMSEDAGTRAPPSPGVPPKRAKVGAGGGFVLSTVLNTLSSLSHLIFKTSLKKLLLFSHFMHEDTEF